MTFKDEMVLRPQDSRQRRSQDGPDSRAQRIIQRLFAQSTPNAARAELQSQAPMVAASDPVSSWIEEIKQVWSRGTGHALELARVIGRARNRLLHGEWTQVVKSLPFSKRKADMLVAVGKRFSWLHAHTFAHLPAGWSVLYQLAKLERTVFEKLIQQDIIHPKLTLQEAKELVARFNGRRRQKQSAGINITRRLRQFCEYVERTLSNWESEERELAKRELRRLIEEIDARDGDPLGRKLDAGRTSHPLGRRIFPDAPRGVTSLTPKTRTTV